LVDNLEALHKMRILFLSGAHLVSNRGKRRCAVR
jgi:hypothetical protein